MARKGTLLTRGNRQGQVLHSFLGQIFELAVGPAGNPGGASYIQRPDNMQPGRRVCCVQLHCGHWRRQITKDLLKARPTKNVSFCLGGLRMPILTESILDDRHRRIHPLVAQLPSQWEHQVLLHKLKRELAGRNVKDVGWALRIVCEDMPQGELAQNSRNSLPQPDQHACGI